MALEVAQISLPRQSAGIHVGMLGLSYAPLRQSVQLYSHLKHHLIHEQEYASP